jgi:hypothetical protein
VSFRLAFSMLAILAALLLGGQTHSLGAALEQSTPSDGTNECLAAVEKYIAVIDSLMAPARNDAWHSTQELQKHLPSCTVGENKLIELAQTSKYFDYYQKAHQLTIWFRTTADKQDFEITLSFDRNRRIILHGSAGHRKKF